MSKRCIWSGCAFAALLAAQANAGPSAGEQTKLDALAAKISGTILYTKGGKVYTMAIGDWTPVEIGDGTYARWSPDASRVAVYYGGNICVMDDDGGNLQTLIGIGGASIIPIDFHTNDEEIVFTAWNYPLQAIKITDQSIRGVATYRDYFGEPSVSADASRMAVREGHNVYAIQIGVGDRRFRDWACSPGVSPDGALLMNNTMDHDKLEIRDWDGSNLYEVSSSTCPPDNIWDNHHWSNHPDYIAVQGDGGGEIYILQVSTPEGTRVTWLGNCSYADLYVENVLSISGTITDTGASAFAANRVVVATDGTDTITTQTNDDGKYMIIGVLAGDYTISAPGYVLTPTGLPGNPVTVSGADVTGADFDAAPQDSDTDLLDDPWEFKYFGDLTSTDGSGDADGDGQTDKEEHDAGTNPTLAPGGTSSNGDDKCGAGAAWIGLAALLAAARILSHRHRSS